MTYVTIKDLAQEKTDDVIELVKDHINSLPNYERHYAAVETNVNKNIIAKTSLCITNVCSSS